MKTLSPIWCCGLAALFALAAGCTTKLGGHTPASQFVYPNSNVTALGPVKYSKSKTAFLVAPRWNIEELRKCYLEAVAQVPGANALVDYREDTRVTSIMLVNTITYTLEGTAVKMEVGRQDIQR